MLDSRDNGCHCHMYAHSYHSSTTNTRRFGYSYELVIALGIASRVHLLTSTANWAAFNATGQVPLHRGQDVIFKCSGPVGHQIQLKEVGQNKTFEELDFLNRLPEYVNSLEYEPLQCNSDPPEGTTICSKVVNMTVTDYMHRKAYKCRSLDTTQNTHVFSAEVRVEGV